MTGQLVVHAGGRAVTLDELRACETPAPEGRWHPAAHVDVLGAVKETLEIRKAAAGLGLEVRPGVFEAA